MNNIYIHLVIVIFNSVEEYYKAQTTEKQNLHQ